MDVIAELSDLAYEAAVVPERWKAFLDAGAEVAGAVGGTLFSVEGMNHNSIYSDSLHEAWLAIIEGGWSAKNPLPQLAVAKRRPGFMHDLEVLPLSERGGMTWFTEFSPQWNLGPSLGTVLQVPDGSRLLMTLERPATAPAYDRADVERFDPLRPSLARAISLSTQLAFRQFETTTGLLNAMGLPSAVVSESGRLLTANPLFEALMPGLFMDWSDRLRMSVRTADALLQETLGRLRPEHWSGTVASIPVPRNDAGDPPSIVHVLPIRGLARDVLFGATGLLLVDRLTERAAPSDMILRALYDLTPAEARVAAALLKNRGGPSAVADALGVSHETVKTQTKSIYNKTGLSGVVELASVLGGVLPADSTRARED
ncbi:hypothetical protein DMC47_06545 [Nostoc sp. 3335mG]|nr:hypothetical protein DMC47_06545 [Nostoc sp. 3335mG]